MMATLWQNAAGDAITAALGIPSKIRHATGCRGFIDRCSMAFSLDRSSSVYESRKFGPFQRNAPAVSATNRAKDTSWVQEKSSMRAASSRRVNGCDAPPDWICAVATTEQLSRPSTIAACSNVAFFATRKNSTVRHSHYIYGPRPAVGRIFPLFALPPEARVNRRAAEIQG